MIKNNLNTEEFHKNKHFDADNIDSKNKVITYKTPNFNIVNENI